MQVCPGMMAFMHLIPLSHSAEVICGKTLLLASISQSPNGPIVATLLKVPRSISLLSLRLKGGHLMAKQKLGSSWL
jgi:hypothetical protein